MLYYLRGDRMVITFVGHRDFRKSERTERDLLNILNHFALRCEQLCCYCGGYGNFDNFAAACVKLLQSRYPNVRNCLILPYKTLEFEKNFRFLQDYYDEIIFPPLGNTPPKFAIVKRNQWMIDNSDIVISCVHRTQGGAARTLAYAKQKRLPICSL